MYSPKISEMLIPYLYREAKNQKTPMTKVVNKAIEIYLLTAKCRNCLTSIELEEPQQTAYCYNCDCEVFLVK